MAYTMEFDHIGCAVRSIEDALKDLEPMGCGSVVSHTDKTVLNTKIAQINMRGLSLELVEPAGSNSPVSHLLKTREMQLYHLCYRVSSLDEALADLTGRGYALITRWQQPNDEALTDSYAYLMTSRGLPVELWEVGV